MEEAIFAAGCFWGVETVFQNAPGVVDTEVGYTGGHTENPTYKQVCSDNTGHAEAVRVVFDPEKTSFEALCQLFWESHDPTTLNRQGPDFGSQYRSAIFYKNEEQKSMAEDSKTAAASDFDRPIVTEITEASTFYAAEEYHQDYFMKNGGPNCHI